MILSLFVIQTARTEESRAPHGLIHPVIIQPVKFKDGTLTGAVGASEIAAMGGRPLKIDDGHSDQFVSLKNVEVQTATLASYRDAIQRGGEIIGGHAIASADRFCNGWAIWEFMSIAKPSRLSIFEKDWLGSLPVGLIDWVGSEERREREADSKDGKRLLDYQKSGKIKKLLVKEKVVTFEGYRSYRIEWLASGDYDGDGLEDRLICVDRWATEGSAFFSESCIVSPKGSKNHSLVFHGHLSESDVSH
jgi:hypothetical protein